MIGEVLAGEDINPGDPVVVIKNVAFKRDPVSASVVTCECDDPSDHKIGDLRYFICAKSLIEVWNLRGSKKHKLVYILQ